MKKKIPKMGVPATGIEPWTLEFKARYIYHYTTRDTHPNQPKNNNIFQIYETSKSL